MQRSGAAVLAWPGARVLAHGVALQCAAGAFWYLAFGLSDWITRLHSRRIRVHFDFELAIPLVPAMTLAYVSLYPLCWLAPFVLRERRQLNQLALAFAGETAAAALCFVLLPARNAFPTPPAEQLGAWAALFQFSDALNLEYNLLPSLHVAYAVTFAGSYARRGWPLLFWSWAGVIALSTVLTHQHHLADVVAGALLGAAALVACTRL